MSIQLIAAFAAITPAFGVNNIGTTAYIGKPSAQPEWVGDDYDFGSTFSPKYDKIKNPVLDYCEGVIATSTPGEIENCVTQLRSSLLCVEDPDQESLSTFVWWSSAVMWGGSTLFASVLNNPESPKDGITGLLTGDPDTVDYFFSQSSFWINFIPMAICSVIGLIMFISLFINLIWFCNEKCRSCWGSCCCKCCCHDRERKPVPQVAKWKVWTQYVYSAIYFAGSLAFIVVFGYYTILFTTPYRMNQTACRIIAANYQLAFGENSLLDVGTRMMAMMIEGGSNNHVSPNMTGTEPILNSPGVGHLNIQEFDRMCPIGFVGPDAMVPTELADFQTAQNWRSAVGQSVYSAAGWDQCYRYSPHWQQARTPYAQKYAWGRIARDYGRRAYYSMVAGFQGEDHRFLYTDEYEGHRHSYVGYPQTCALEDADGNRECAFIRKATYKNDGSAPEYVTTCRKGQEDGVDCHRYNDMDAKDTPDTDFSGELNKPYDFYYRTTDRNKAHILHDEFFGPFVSEKLENTLGFHVNSGGFQAQGTVYDDIVTRGSLESPSALTTLVGNMVNADLDGDVDPATMIGWIRTQCAQRETSNFTFGDFCMKTMGSELQKGGAMGGVESGYCQSFIDNEDATVVNESNLSVVMANSDYGRGYQQCVIGSNSGSCLFSDSGALSNREDICDVFLARNVASRGDDEFSIDAFVQFYRGSPSAIESTRTAKVGVTVGAYPNTGNYTDATAQHTYIIDAFDSSNYDGEFSDSILAPRPAHIVTPQSAEHPPFIGFYRLSNYIDSLITVATHHTATKIQRWPEYFSFLLIVHSAIWTIYGSAMDILYILPVFAPTADGHSTGWQTMITLSIVFTTLFSILWVGMLVVWSMIGIKWCKKIEPTPKQAGCFYRSLCGCLSIGNLCFCLFFMITSLIVPIVGEVALFCNLDAMAKVALDGEVLPPLYVDLFGPQEDPHPGDDSPYQNSLAECVYHGHGFDEGSINFTTSQETRDAAEELVINLPLLLKAYEEAGVVIDESSFENEFAPIWNNGDFVHKEGKEWTPRTKTFNMLKIMDQLEEARDSAITAIQNRLEQVVVSTTRGIQKKTDGDEVTYVNVGDSVFDPMMSTLVDDTLSVVYINDSDVDLEIDSSAADVLYRNIASLADSYLAAFEKASVPFWLGRKPQYLGEGYLYNGDKQLSGVVSRSSDYATYGDFYSAIVNERDFTDDAATLKYSSADTYLSNFSESTVPGVVRLDAILSSLSEKVNQKFDSIMASYNHATTIPTWDKAAVAWLDKFYQGELDKPLMERKICYKSEEEPTGYTPQELFDMGVDINIKDICILSVRRPVTHSYYVLEEINTQLEDDTQWEPRADSVLMPVAGACVEEYQKFIDDLELPELNDDGVPVGGETARQTLLDWHKTACSTLEPDNEAPYYCIKPMRRLEQLIGGIGVNIQPDLIIEATEDEAQIRENYSGLLPYNYGLYKGRDARWTNPIYPLFADDQLDISEFTWTYAAGSPYGLGTGPDFGVPVFGTHTGIIFGDHAMPPAGFADLPGFVEYRKCLLGPDVVFPISSDRTDETQEYLDYVGNLQANIDARAGAYERLLQFMVNLEMIQRHATMSHNYKARGPQAISELGIVEDYFKMLNLLSLPTRENALKSIDEISSEVEARVRYITDGTAVVTNVAQCAAINEVSTEAIKNICGGALGLIAMVVWQLWLMSALFLVFYCCGFKQMHYWINQKLKANEPQSSSSSSDDVDYLNAAYHGHTAVFTKDNTSKGDLKVVDDQKNTTLHMAAFKNHHETIEAICAINSDLVNERNSAYYMPLHIAVYENNVEAVTALCKHGANMNARDEFGDTPLSAAARLGHKEIVSALLAAGADPLQATRSLKFPADIAAILGHDAISKDIRKHYDDEKLRKARTYYENHSYSSYSSYEFDYYYEKSHSTIPVAAVAAVATAAKTATSSSSSEVHRSISISDEPVIMKKSMTSSLKSKSVSDLKSKSVSSELKAKSRSISDKTSSSSEEANLNKTVEVKSRSRSASSSSTSSSSRE